MQAMLAESNPLTLPSNVLKSDLEQLETMARRPVTAFAPGVRRRELMRAVETIQVRWRSVRQVHRSLREEAVQLDPALRSRAKRLADTERRLVARLIALHRHVFDLLPEQDDEEERETRAALQRWCVLCRGQLQEHARLLQDAHYRDRGFAH